MDTTIAARVIADAMRPHTGEEFEVVDVEARGASILFILHDLATGETHNFKLTCEED